METTRQATSRRRTTLLMVLLMCLPMTLVAYQVRPTQATAYDMFLRQSMESYPKWISQGWLPMNAVVAMTMIYLAISVTTHLYHAPLNVLTMIKVSYGFLGGMIGGVMAMVLGWYVGIETFIFSGTFCTILLFIISGMAYVAWWGANRAQKYYQAHMATRLAPVVRPLKRYFNAEDIPDEEQN